MFSVEELRTFILLVYFVAVCRRNPFIARLESCEIFSSNSNPHAVFVFHCGPSATVNNCLKNRLDFGRERTFIREVVHSFVINIEGVVREEHEIVCCTGEL
jgi:hypothetical protein